MFIFFFIYGICNSQLLPAAHCWDWISFRSIRLSLAKMDHSFQNDLNTVVVAIRVFGR
jgi:hypothetical protein